jgi:M6 family metalloprotease-like protein
VIRSFVAAGTLILAWPALAADPDPKEVLAGYKTVEQAKLTTIRTSRAGQAGLVGYLGISLRADARGRPVVEDVPLDSPAAKAGVKPGDVLTRAGGQPIRGSQSFREWVQTQTPGETVKLGLERDGAAIEITAEVGAVSRPMKPPTGPPPFHGLEIVEVKEGDGVKVQSVADASPAAVAGLKTGDLVLKLNGDEINRPGRLQEMVREKRPGDAINLTVIREGKELEVKVTLAANRPGAGGKGGFGGGGGGGRGGGFGGGSPTLWTKATMRLGVVGIEFPDVKHNDKVTPAELEKLFFSKGTYTDTSVTGQKVSGSLNDYLREVSAGAFHIEGKVFPWIEVGKKRGDYVQGSGTSNKTAVLTEALDRLLNRDGKDALKDFDGILFVYAGDMYRTNRGAVYYPHAGTVGHQLRRFPYLLGPEGGSRLSSLNTFVKEMGLVLGLPDLAARTENVGSEGLGAWCALSEVKTTGRPEHFSPWCKEKLGWLKPAVIDPTDKQKLVLSPIEGSSRECFKALVRPDGSEYLLLENRAKKGFDADLPAEGLLIWRVVNDRPILEEAHGVTGPTGPTVHLGAVPYPSSANTAFTPDTIPSSRSPRGGGQPVHITNIRRHADGKVSFLIGYEYE